jgi:hypothetical protein
LTAAPWRKSQGGGRAERVVALVKQHLNRLCVPVDEAAGVLPRDGSIMAPRAE